MLKPPPWPSALLSNESGGSEAAHSLHTPIFTGVSSVEVGPEAFLPPLCPPGALSRALGRFILMDSQEYSAHRRQRQTQQNRSSPDMAATMEFCDLAAKCDSSVLITGETGSGKDYLASYIHENSSREKGPFLTVNCAAIPEALAESELFGHEHGAFTGTTRRQRGVLQLADSGTLLLNEIGDLPLPLQAKLLTFLDSQEVRSLGADTFRMLNVRIIAATNKVLEKEVQEGRFRPDLFYRLDVCHIVVPPLRRRKEEIPGLARDLLLKIVAAQDLKAVPQFDDRALSMLQEHDWPGNVRELKNVIERAVIKSDGKPMIRAENLVFRAPQGDGSLDKLTTARRVIAGGLPSEDKLPRRESAVRTKSTASDDDLKYMYEVICGGSKGAVAAIARALEKDRPYVSKELNRIRGMKAPLGRPSKREAERMEQDLKVWLAQRDQA